MTTTPQVFPNAEVLGQQAAALIAEIAAEAVAQRGQFTVALSGGSLPKIISPPLLERDDIDWPAWRVFWADERCVPLDDPDSNYRLAGEQLLQQVDISAAHIYPIDPTLPPPQIATAYQETLRRVFAPAGDFPRFDLILLGMGEDGHTASLFPGHPLLAEREAWVAALEDSPKPPPARVTLTLPLLNAAHHVAFVTTGSSKAEILPQVLAPNSTLPAGLVRPHSGQVHWLIDQAAAARLS